MKKIKIEKLTYAYKNKEGNLRIAMDGQLLFIIMFCWPLIPLLAIGQFIWHFFKKNTFLITEEQYYKSKYLERKNEKL